MLRAHNVHIAVAAVLDGADTYARLTRFNAKVTLHRAYWHVAGTLRYADLSDADRWACDLINMAIIDLEREA